MFKTLECPGIIVFSHFFLGSLIGLFNILPRIQTFFRVDLKYGDFNYQVILIHKSFILLINP